MKMEIVATIISVVCTILAVIAGYYIYIRKKIEEEALNAINKAEDTDKIGEEKMKEAVETVYSVIPTVAKPFISKQIIETIVQGIFDKVEEYARKQVSKEKTKE